MTPASDLGRIDRLVAVGIASARKAKPYEVHGLGVRLKIDAESGTGFVTPEDPHTGADVAILLLRRAVYRRANKRHPERWTGNIRAWARPETVTLHPDRPAITLQPR